MEASVLRDVLQWGRRRNYMNKAHKPFLPDYLYKLGSSGSVLSFYSEVATGSAALVMRLVTDCWVHPPPLAHLEVYIHIHRTLVYIPLKHKSQSRRHC